MEQIKGEILSGKILPGQKLLSENQYAERYSMSRHTVRKALGILEQQGYIYSVKGKGNYVSNVTALAEQKRKHIMKEAERLLSIGKDMGIARSEYTAVLDRLYGKEDPDDRTEKS